MEMNRTGGCGASPIVVRDQKEFTAQPVASGHFALSGPRIPVTCRQVNDAFNSPNVGRFLENPQPVQAVRSRHIQMSKFKFGADLKYSEPVGSVRPQMSFETKLLSTSRRRSQPVVMFCQAQGFPTPVVR